MSVLAFDTNLAFDGCGNKTSLNSAPYLPANNMNQPTDPGIIYDTNGNLKTYNGYAYTYDAQNRLRTVINTNNVAVAQFWYDGLNRQVARSTTAVTIPNLPVTTTTFSVWDGDWAILEEYTTSNVLTQSYVQGAHGLVKTLPNNIYYYQDSLGSTSHITNAAGALMEYYKYDLYGKPTYWTAINNQLSTSNYSVRDLHGGQRWIPELGLYDDRNRFMSPDLGRFLQPDPIGFKGDSSNLYRYVGNDWANRTDPMGLEAGPSAFTHANRIATMNKEYVEITGSHIKVDASKVDRVLAARESAGLSTVRARSAQSAAEGRFQAEVRRAIASGPRLAQVGEEPPQRPNAGDGESSTNLVRQPSGRTIQDCEKLKEPKAEDYKMKTYEGCRDFTKDTYNWEKRHICFPCVDGMPTLVRPDCLRLYNDDKLSERIRTGCPPPPPNGGY